MLQTNLQMAKSSESTLSRISTAVLLNWSKVFRIILQIIILFILSDKRTTNDPLNVKSQTTATASTGHRTKLHLQSRTRLNYFLWIMYYFHNFHLIK